MSKPVSGAACAPDRLTPRLFVGGLSARVTDAALQRLLGKFGTPGAIERNATRGFAHVSLVPRDPASIDRCVAALNNTSWCGMALRVQKAKEHFWHRLEREWEPPQESPVEEDSGGNEGKGEGDGNDAAPRFKGAGEGVRIVFSFPDLECDAVMEPGQLGELGEAVPSGDGSGGKVDEEGACTVVRAGENAVAARHDNSNGTTKAHVPQSETLSSTMQLFGLSESVAVMRKRTVAVAPEDEMEISTQTESRPAKRPRKKSSDVELDEAEIAAHEPGRIDLQSEKERALSVLDNIFSTAGQKAKTRAERIAACRRPGLFRKLEIKQADQQTQQTGKQKRRRRMRNISSSSKQKGAIGLPKCSPNDISEERTGESEQPNTYRKAGLYRKLMQLNISSTDPSDGDQNAKLS